MSLIYDIWRHRSSTFYVIRNGPTRELATTHSALLQPCGATHEALPRHALSFFFVALDRAAERLELASRIWFAPAFPHQRTSFASPASPSALAAPVSTRLAATMSSQGSKPTKVAGNASPPLASSLPTENGLRKNFDTTHQTKPAESSGNPSRVNCRSPSAEVQRCAQSPSADTVFASSFRDTGGATRVSRFPNQERSRDQEFREVGTRKADVVHITGNPSSNRDDYTEGDPGPRPVSSLPRPRSATYNQERTGSSISQALRADRTELTLEPDEGAHRFIPPLPTPTRFSPTNFLVVILPPPLNLVRRYAPHSVRLDVELTDPDIPTSRTVSVTFIGDNPSPPAWFEPSQPRMSPLTTIPEFGTIPTGGGARSGVQVFSPRGIHQPNRTRRSTVSDEGSDSDSKSEDFFTPETSPEAFSSSPLILQDTIHRPAPPSFSPAPASSPHLHLVSSPSTVRSSTPNFGPYIPQYPTPAPSITVPSMSDVGGSSRNPSIPVSPAPHSLRDHLSVAERSPNRTSQPHAQALFQFMGDRNVINVHNVHQSANQER